MPPETLGYVTSGEFRQFERRMDERFRSLDARLGSLDSKLDVLGETVEAVIHEDHQEDWLGPRAQRVIAFLAPALLGGAIAIAVAYLTHGLL